MHRLKEVAFFSVGIYCFWKTFSYFIDSYCENETQRMKLFLTEEEEKEKEREEEEVRRMVRSRRREKKEEE